MKILVIGGGGYVGSLLVERLLEKSFEVKVLDLFLFENPKTLFRDSLNLNLLTTIKGDLRDIDLLANIIPTVNIVIHLACISNDPSFELDPKLGKSINYDSFYPLIKICKKNRIDRFVYASSSSVYGIKDIPDVTENLTLDPLTDYSKYKVLCEEILLNELGGKICSTILRPATVCGYSKRTRLDVIVNILTNNAYNKRKFIIYGGSQKRPNIHIEDMVDSYLKVLENEKTRVSDQIFNVGFENHTLLEIGNLVKEVIGKDVLMEFEETDDLRSYHISSKKIAEKINFFPKHSIKQAISDLQNAFKSNLLKDSMKNPKYFNIKTMQLLNLK
tara:strand:+ start:690 stop:1682 length:993 start_codon:yes stop_codon:yes gene_type:complete